MDGPIPETPPTQPGEHEVLTDALAARMMEVSADTVMLVRPSGHIAVVSSTATIRLGRPLDYWEGRHFRDLIHPEDAPAFRRMLDGDPDDPYALRRDVLRVRVLSATTNEWLLLETRGFTRIRHGSIEGSVVSFRDAAGLVGLSESRGLAAATIADDGEATDTLDIRQLTAGEILPAVLRNCASAKHLCVIGVRMTNFDAVAAAHGRREADRTVTHSARAIGKVVRPTDFVIRVLDRRLVIACPNLEPGVVMDFAGRVRWACGRIRRASGVTMIPSMGFVLTSGNDDLRQVLDFALEANQLDCDSDSPDRRKAFGSGPVA